MILRTRKADSAYLYQVLESYEGLTNYSTLPEQKGSPFREVELHIAPDLRPAVETLLRRLQDEIFLEIRSA
jgi:hypothetical protein